MIDILKYIENFKFIEYIELYRYNIILGILLLLVFAILYRCFITLTRKGIL